MPAKQEVGRSCCPWGCRALLGCWGAHPTLGALGVGVLCPAPAACPRLQQSLSLAAPGPSGVRQRLRGGGRGVRLRLAGGELGPGPAVSSRAGSGLTCLPLAPAGMRQERRQLLQEVHVDPRRHVQRRAVLQGLQGAGQAAGTVSCGTQSPWGLRGFLCRRVCLPLRSMSRVACPAGRL